METKQPTPTEIKEIFKETYIYFEKYKNATTDNDWLVAVREAKEIRDRLNFELTETILIKLQEVIEDYWRKGK